MANAPAAPCLRRIEAFPAVVDGREVICLRDPSGLTEAVLTVPRPAAPILALMDGTRTVAHIQADIMREYGQLLAREQIQGLVDALDRHLFLVYAVLVTFPAGRGRLLKYGQWPDPQAVVTFASVAFEEDGS